MVSAARLPLLLGHGGCRMLHLYPRTDAGQPRLGAFGWRAGSTAPLRAGSTRTGCLISTRRTGPPPIRRRRCCAIRDDWAMPRQRTVDHGRGASKQG